MIAWYLLIIFYGFISLVSVMVYSWIGVLVSVGIWLTISFTVYTTILDGRGYRSLLWPFWIPKSLCSGTSPYPAEVSLALSQLYMAYPELREALDVINHSYYYRHHLCEKLPLMFPKGVKAHIVNYLHKHDLITSELWKRVMLDNITL